MIGTSTRLLEPLAVAIGRHVLNGEAIFADDTPVKMLAPGSGKTKTARLWTYVRDERLWVGDAPQAAWYQFSPDRKGARPREHLADYTGWMHADGYAGFEDLYRSGKIHEVACMAHIRRKFVDVHKSQASAIAEEAVLRIARLYGVEKGTLRLCFFNSLIFHNFVYFHIPTAHEHAHNTSLKLPDFQSFVTQVIRQQRAF